MTDIDDQRVRPALDAILEGDAQRLQSAIDADPEIVTAKCSENTLLEWLTQPPHYNDPDIINVLIANGARLDGALNLAACWNLEEMCRRLLAAGSDPSVRASEGITPLESAAMHGSTRAADALAPHGLHRPSLWLAAASGRLPEVKTWVDAAGHLLRPPGPYRPNLADVGHPPGSPPTDDPGEIIGEALVFAGANDRMTIVDYLVAGGADINARPYVNTTALHLAILFRKADAVGHLLERGAALDIADDHYESDAKGWARACLNDDPASEQIAAMVTAAS